ncbi:MAG: hypothetical protein HUU54_12175 [Ignavibacteriaceae bacterium]|nr:hypothetical protein [Ignavibacteriaceae bacterium]
MFIYKIPSILLTVILLQINIFPANRYVIAGNPTPIPPYTSWATACDSIQKCIDISNSGDTIFVGAGVYKEKVVLKPRLTLIGSGTDSCIVDISVYPEPPTGGDYHYAFSVKDSCTIKNFFIKGKYDGMDNGWVGIGRPSWPWPMLNVTYLLVENNHFHKLDVAASLNHGIFRKNLVTNSLNGISCNPFPSAGIIIVDSNRFSNLDYALCIGDGYVILRNNFIHFRSGGVVTEVFEAHLYSRVWNNIAIRTDGRLCYETFNSNGDFINNVIFLKSKSVFNPKSATDLFVNNVVIGADSGVTISGSASIDNIKYNNFWKVGKRYANFAIINDSTNLSVDPMFVKEHISWDTAFGDYHLQKFSLLIDKGDPTILDPDGTRSDVGTYGGPLGEIYAYRDYAPKPPAGIILRYDPKSKIVEVKWERATEADFSRYNVYKDTLSGFISDSSRILLSTIDTSFSMSLTGYRKIFFNIRVVDKQGNISEPGTETGIVLTDTQPEKIVTEQYKLYPNYPNPFSFKTTIGYYVCKQSFIKIMVYDIKGEMIGYLENSERGKGYYEAEFTGAKPATEEFGTETDFVSGMYIYKIFIIDSETGIPVFSQTRKMMRVK